MTRNLKLIHTLLVIAVVAVSMVSCGQSYEETRRLSREEQARLKTADSLAFKVGVLPTLDCLPLFVARDRALFDTTVDIRLKQYRKQADCDKALSTGRLECNVTDLVRALRMRQQGVGLEFLSSTGAYWQLVSNRLARIKQIKQLDDKMIAMTRYSATALLADYAVDSVRLKSEQVFRVQINDANLRLKMLLNNEMDAALLPEPQATTARLYKNPVLMDSRDKNLRLGLIALSLKARNDKSRKRQVEAFIKGYNAACDSINKYGIKNYAALIEKYCGTDSRTIAALPQLKFRHIEKPRQRDIDRAARWLK